MTADSGEVQQMLTDRKIPCPECGKPTLGARAFDAKERKAFIGVACRECDKVYHVDLGGQQ